MASIEKTSKGGYRLRVKFGNRSLSITTNGTRGMAEFMAAQIERLKACRDAGERPIGDLSEWLKGLPESITKKLASADLIDDKRASASLPLERHIDDYISSCEHEGQTGQYVRTKRLHLSRLAEHIGAKRLTDIKREPVESFLISLKKADHSAKNINDHRATAITFINWCVERGRIDQNPLVGIKQLNVKQDRRYVRRALTVDELSRLLEVAESRPLRELMTIRTGPNKGQLGAKVRDSVKQKAIERGRHRRAVYLTAALCGLRRKELGLIQWGDIDFEDRVITVRIEVGKAKRTDHVPMHPMLAETLADLRPQDVNVIDPVFPIVPTCKIVNEDIQAAGIPLVDDQGRHVGLHGLRTTLGTNLAKAGVAPQVARQIMRHADYRTTLEHYTTLSIHDAVAAIDQIDVQPNQTTAPVTLLATGTDTSDVMPTTTGDGVKGSLACQQFVKPDVPNASKVSVTVLGDENRMGAGIPELGVQNASKPLNDKTLVNNCPQVSLMPPEGLEPSTNRLRAGCSTN